MSKSQDDRAFGFVRNPEDAGFEPRIEIVRTPGNKMIKAIVVSTDIVGAMTHWNGHQTRPHTTPWCEHCERGTKVDWHGYVGILDWHTRERSILEFPVGPKQHFDEYIKRHGSLKGAQLLANRVSNQTNSRIRIALSPSKELMMTIPEGPNIVDFLLKMWRMPNGLLVYPPDAQPTQPQNGRQHENERFGPSDLLDLANKLKSERGL